MNRPADRPQAKVGSDPTTVAGVIARSLKGRGIDRVFGLCGGHIMPLWMRLDAEGIAIVDVRDERAAVFMAHAYGELKGTFGVALVTAGPGVTNAMTGIANARAARASVLVLAGLPPRAQEGRGALQDLAGAKLAESITRHARTLREPALVLQALDEAVARALGDGGEPGPVLLDIPTDVLRAEVPEACRDEHFRRRAPSHVALDPAALEQAVDLLWGARHPLIIAGKGARKAGPSLIRLLDATGALYLDTAESRGIVPTGHRAFVGAMRGVVMGEADVVVTVGRRLDFQLAYGSQAVFGDAKFLRIADSVADLRDNRRGEVELLADCDTALAALVASAHGRVPNTDRAWVRDMRQRHEERVQKLREGMASAPPDASGRMHPNRLLGSLQSRLKPDAIVVTDGGDFLSFARVGLDAATWLDPGPLGTLGVGVPFGIAAALACPDRDVVVATGDGAFGFGAMELDTAVRHGVPLLVVVANNAAWQIEVYDQRETYGKVVGTELRSSDYAALARSLGLHGERVLCFEELSGALDRAWSQRPALLDVVVSPDAVSSDAKSGLAWVPDLQPLASWDAAERRLRNG